VSTTIEGIEPGIHPGLSMGEYLALPFMSASKLEQLRRSPLHYQHSLLAGPSSSPAMELGSALHLLLLEPLLFATAYRVAGPCEQPLKSGARKGEPCGNTGAALHSDLGWLCGVHMKGCGDGIEGGFQTISADDDTAVRAMCASILSHPRARTLFEGSGAYEVTVVFDDPETGVRCKIRPDRLIERAGMLVDVKTTRDAATWAFPRDAENRGYFRKMAFYRRGLRAAGWPYASAAVVAAESGAPYDLICYLLEEDDLDGAEKEVVRLLRTFRTCEEMNVWPGYAQEFQPMRRPAWAKEDFNGIE
jgi:hypothetical protein